MVFCSQVCPFCSPSPCLRNRTARKKPLDSANYSQRHFDSVNPCTKIRTRSKAACLNTLKNLFGKAEPPLDGIRFMYYSSP